MSDQEVVIYVSDNSLPCKQLLNHMDKWNISYRVKNVNKNSEYMRDLQEQGIYGTPATFIKSQKHVILGFQEKKINHALGIGDYFSNYQSYNE